MQVNKIATCFCWRGFFFQYTVRVGNKIAFLYILQHTDWNKDCNKSQVAKINRKLFPLGHPYICKVMRLFVIH